MKLIHLISRFWPELFLIFWLTAHICIFSLFVTKFGVLAFDFVWSINTLTSLIFIYIFFFIFSRKCHYFNSKSKEDVIEHFLDIKGPHGYTNFNYILVSLCVVKQQQKQQIIDYKDSHPAPSKQPKLENNSNGNGNKNEHHARPEDNHDNNVEAINNHDSNRYEECLKKIWPVCSK